MVVLVLENVPTRLRGELTRWMIEPRAGVFVGRLSAMVRDKLWDKVCQEAGDGGGILLYTSPTEQGFLVRTFGDTTRTIRDFDGIVLVHVPRKSQTPKHSAPLHPNLVDT